MNKQSITFLITALVITAVLSLDVTAVYGAGSSFSEAQVIEAGKIENEKLGLGKANFYKIKTTPGQMIKATLDFVVADYQKGNVIDEIYYTGRVHIQMYSGETRKMLVEEESDQIGGSGDLGKDISLYPDWGLPIRKIAKYLTSTADESEYIFIKVSYTNMFNYPLFKSIVYNLNMELIGYYDAGYQTDAPHKFAGAFELNEGEYTENYLSYKSYPGRKDKLGSDWEDYFKVKLPAGAKLIVRIKPADKGTNRLFLYAGEDHKEVSDQESQNQGQILAGEYENKSNREEEVFIKVVDPYNTNDGFKYGIEVKFEGKKTTGPVVLSDGEAGGISSYVAGRAVGTIIFGILIVLGLAWVLRLPKRLKAESGLLGKEGSHSEKEKEAKEREKKPPLDRLFGR